MKNTNTQINQMVNAMNTSGGRFFGLTTTSGEQINAQFVSATPKTVVIYDRNRFTHRRLMKSSLKRMRMGSVSVGY
jgi:hypothetical protein